MDSSVIEQKQENVVDNESAPPETNAIKRRIELALSEFDALITQSVCLEIDAFLEKGANLSGPIQPNMMQSVKDYVAEDDGFKVINHELENAYFVPMREIMKATKDELVAIITSLADGVFQRVHGVTRIVGYYSRVNNWNASKIGELRDRRSGNYWDKKRKNTKVKSIGE